MNNIIVPKSSVDERVKELAKVNALFELIKTSHPELTPQIGEVIGRFQRDQRKKLN